MSKHRYSMKFFNMDAVALKSLQRFLVKNSKLPPGTVLTKERFRVCYPTTKKVIKEAFQVHTKIPIHAIDNLRKFLLANWTLIKKGPLALINTPIALCIWLTHFQNQVEVPGTTWGNPRQSKAMQIFKVLFPEVENNSFIQLGQNAVRALMQSPKFIRVAENLDNYNEDLPVEYGIRLLSLLRRSIAEKMRNAEFREYEKQRAIDEERLHHYELPVEPDEDEQGMVPKKQRHLRSNDEQYNSYDEEDSQDILLRQRAEEVISREQTLAMERIDLNLLKGHLESQANALKAKEEEINATKERLAAAKAEMHRCLETLTTILGNN